jgi:pyruvate dehydrogenase (quinone)
VFAAVAYARLTGQPVAVCGTVGLGVVHLVNGLLDARKEGAPVIAIAMDTESSILDSDTVEELNPYIFFAAAALYIGRLVNPHQLRTVVGRTITTAVAERGPAVISLPGDVAAADAPTGSLRVALPATTPNVASASDLAAMAALINEAETVAVFGGDGCEQGSLKVFLPACEVDRDWIWPGAVRLLHFGAARFDPAVVAISVLPPSAGGGVVWLPCEAGLITPARSSGTPLRR